MIGCGVIFGLLIAVVVIVVQSYGEIYSVKIIFGVGIVNWEVYCVIICEDIGYLFGYDVEKVKVMIDVEVEVLLESINGLLNLQNMEYVDDIMLELVGICDCD